MATVSAESTRKLNIPIRVYCSTLEFSESGFQTDSRLHEKCRFDRPHELSRSPHLIQLDSSVSVRVRSERLLNHAPISVSFQFRLGQVSFLLRGHSNFTMVSFRVFPLLFEVDRYYQTLAWQSSRQSMQEEKRVLRKLTRSSFLSVCFHR